MFSLQINVNFVFKKKRITVHLVLFCCLSVSSRYCCNGGCQILQKGLYAEFLHLQTMLFLHLYLCYIPVCVHYARVRSVHYGLPTSIHYTPPHLHNTSFLHLYTLPVLDLFTMAFLHQYIILPHICTTHHSYISTLCPSYIYTLCSPHI